MKELLQNIYDIEIPNLNLDPYWSKQRYILNKLFLWYSTSVAGERYDRTTGRSVKGRTYTLSIKRYKQCVPYSLKLRLEYYKEQGITPTLHNMQLPKDTLDGKTRSCRRGSAQRLREAKRQRAMESRDER